MASIPPSPRLPQDDPFDWTVEQVIHQFCRPDLPWGGAQDARLEPVFLESQLRNNHVSGELLLTYLDNLDRLRDELGVKSLGHRFTIKKGIQYLQARSQKYQTSTASDPRLPHNTPVTAVDTWLQSSVPPFEAQSRNATSIHSTLRPPVLSPQLPRQISSSIAQPDVSQALQTSEPVTKKRKRVAPTFVAHLDAKWASQDPLFAQVDDVDVSENEHEFSSVGHKVDNGLRKHVYRNLKRSWAQSEAHDPGSSEQESDGEEGEWDYLLSKYPANPDLEGDLAPYGESSDDLELDEETREEIERDKVEDVVTGPKEALSHAEVDSIIDEAIAEYESIWRQTRFTMAQAKGYRMWKKARQSGKIQDELKTAQFWISRKSTSISRLRKAILAETWTKTSALRKQCQSLDESVFQLQEQRYNQSILAKESSPPRPMFSTVRDDKERQAQNQVDQISEGEILLESESELSMSNFVVDDDADDQTMPDAEPSSPIQHELRPTPKLRATTTPRRLRLPLFQSDSSVSDPNVSAKTNHQDMGDDPTNPIEVSSTDVSPVGQVQTMIDNLPPPIKSQDFMTKLLPTTPTRVKLNPPKRPAAADMPFSNRQPNRASSVDSQSTDSDSEPIMPPSSGKRHRFVPQSVKAKSTQLMGRQRKEANDKQFAALERKLQLMPRNEGATHIISTSKPVIQLDPKISERVKQHQVSGIRFMWREIITDLNEEGCLLAHTMGLGKTMQVIALLVTIAQSAASSDMAIREQIPRELRNSQVLILCPPTLIDNWHDEFLLWQPDQSTLGEIYPITQRLNSTQRVQEIAYWASDGGILIISYDTFRNLILNKPVGPERRERLSSAIHRQVQQQLLEQPSIIIADEAHKMKNSASAISGATARFRSKRRIALTGSPLANNLDEYFAMIDWIAPGFLGDKRQFNFKYGKPIEDGLWNDSDIYMRRLSLRKLNVLSRDLAPKIDRADITAISADLPPKTEFFITIPLTTLQTKAYNLFVRTMLPEIAGSTGASNIRLFGWLSLLGLLCAHPSAFLTKLDDRGNKDRLVRPKAGHKSRKKDLLNDECAADSVEETGLLKDVALADTDVSDEVMTELRSQVHKMFANLEDSGQLEDLSLSHRCQTACAIIENSVRAGDKILVFSHSIPTLNFLEAMVREKEISVRRIDGATAVTGRQDLVKDFNRASSKSNVFLISTKAGGLGLNLQGANRVIIFDYNFNPIWEEQAIGRAYRLGQKKAVFVYRLRTAGTFEEVIFNKAVFKTQLAGRVVDKRNAVRYASKKATDYLFEVKPTMQEELDSFFNKDPDVLDHLLTARDQHHILSIELTETFQKEEEETLSPEEAKQADAEFQDEQDQRNDPVGWQKKQAQALAVRRLQQQAIMPTQLAIPFLPTMPFSSTMPSLPTMPSMSMKPILPASLLPSTQSIIPTVPVSLIAPSSTTNTIRSPHFSTPAPPPSQLPQYPAYQNRQPPSLPTPPTLVSHSGAVGGSNQAENGYWDHRTNPYVENLMKPALVLGMSPSRQSSISNQVPPSTSNTPPDTGPKLDQMDGSARDESARDESARDDGTRDESAQGEGARDEIAQDERARDESALSTLDSVMNDGTCKQQ